MSLHAALLSKIEAFLSTRDIAESTFGRMVVNDGKFMNRLRAHEGMTIATWEKVSRFIDEQMEHDIARRVASREREDA